MLVAACPFRYPRPGDRHRPYPIRPPHGAGRLRLVGRASALLQGAGPRPRDPDRRPPDPVVAHLPGRARDAVEALAGHSLGFGQSPGRAHPSAHRGADRNQLAGLYLRRRQRPCAGRQPRLLSQPPGQRAARRVPAQGEAQPVPEGRRRLGRRRSRDPGFGRRRGDLDQPHPRRQLRDLRFPEESGAGRIRSRDCGSRPCSSRRWRSAG